MSKREMGVILEMHGKGRVMLDELLPEEVAKFRASMVEGVQWIRRGLDGRLEAKAHVNPSHVVLDPTASLDQASIIIQSVCGYHYTPERYKTETSKLERYGFECLRSKAGEDGKYWEMWFLPSALCAKNELKAAVDGKFMKEAVDAAVRFLMNNVLFGTIEASGQRWGMAVD